MTFDIISPAIRLDQGKPSPKMKRPLLLEPGESTLEGRTSTYEIVRTS